MKIFKLEEICTLTGIDDEMLIEFVRREWIQPASPANLEFDEEDLARLHLILDLMNKLEVNDEAIPIVLHLIDQVHRLRIDLHKRPS